VKARVGGVGGSPEREEGMGEETEREERGRETDIRFHPKNEKGGIDWNLHDWGGRDKKLQERHRKTRTPYVGTNTSLCAEVPCFMIQ
jgi:hypothetical protein